MTKTKSTKRALLMSMLSMLLCIAMLVGSTFAWFTDSVTSGNNKILDGNLDVELEYATAEAAKDGIVETEWTKVNETTESLFTDGALWEPGYTEVVYLRVKNAGTLALKYKLGINVASKVIGKTADDKDIDLANFIEFGVAEIDTPFANRSDARDAVKADAVKLSAGYASKSETTLDKEETSAPFALVVYMPEEVGNDANYGTGKTKPEITLGINLVATQATVEEDSFNNLYDADAKYPEVATGTTTWYETAGDPSDTDTYTLTSASELAGLAKLVNEGKDFADKTITLASDIALDGVSNWIPIGTEEHPFKGTFNGADHTVSGLFINSEIATDCISFIGCADAATIENLTVAGNIVVNRDGIVSRPHTAGTCISGICAFADNGTKINRCVSKVDIEAESFDKQLQIGGILGAAALYSGAEITNCINEGNITVDEDAITQTSFVGGIFSYSYNFRGKIENVLNVGNVPEMEIPTDPSEDPFGIRLYSGSITTLFIGGTIDNIYSTTGKILYIPEDIVANTLSKKKPLTENDFSALLEDDNWQWNADTKLPELKPLD